MRQPIEDKAVSNSRAQGSLMFPANFLLVAAMMQANLLIRSHHQAHGRRGG